MFMVDFLTVFVAAIVYFMIRSISFSFLFHEKLKKRRWKYLTDFLFIYLSSLFLEILEIYLKVTSFSDGVFIGLFVWLGFVFTTQTFFLFSEKKSLKTGLIELCSSFLGYAVMGGILAG